MSTLVGSFNSSCQIGKRKNPKQMPNDFENKKDVNETAARIADVSTMLPRENYSEKVYPRKNFKDDPHISDEQSENEEEFDLLNNFNVEESSEIKFPLLLKRSVRELRPRMKTS